MTIERFADDPTAREWAATADGTLRVAVVGLGWWSREFALPALAAAEGCEPTVAVSGAAEKRATAAEAWNLDATLTYDEYADGTAVDAYDAVYVCTPNTTHRDHVETAALHGKAVCCEKPMAADPDDAAAMVAACADAGVPLFVAYRLQTDPAMRRLRDCLQNGVVGRPRQVHGHMSQPLLEMGDGGGGWRLDPTLVGTGTSVTDLGIYPLNTARFLLDEDPRRANATMGAPSEAFEDVPDEHAAFTLTFPSGATAQCSVSQNAHLTGHLQVVGTDGSLTLDGAFFGNETHRLRVRADGETATETWTPPDQMREVFAVFAQRVLADETIGPNGAHALVDVAATAAIYEAAERGRAVPVRPP